MTDITRRNILTAVPAMGLLAGFGTLPFAALAQEGGTLRVALSESSADLNAHTYNGVLKFQSMIYEGLVQYGPKGTILPALAESWAMSDDGLSYTFRLRPGVTFHDGAPFDAAAVKWNFDRWAGMPDHNWLLISTYFDSLIEIDPLTVQLKLKKPVATALYELTVIRPVRFLSPTSVAADGTYVSPVGTGPWKLVEASDSGSVLDRNDSYWGEKPKVARVEFRVIPDSRSRVQALKAGDIDMIGGDFIAQVTPEEAITLQGDGIPVVIEEGLMTLILGFNFDRPVLQDKNVREAISLAIDRSAISQVLYAGLAVPTVDPYPPTMPHMGPASPVPARDVDAARTLLDASGWTGEGVRQKDGQPLALELVVSEESTPGARAAAEVLQAELAEIGIALTIRLVDHATKHEDIPARKYDLAFFLTYGPPYDPHGSLSTYYLSYVDSGPDGKIWVSDELDKQVVAAVEAISDQDAAYARLWAWFAENKVMAPMLIAPRIWAHSAKVSGFQMPVTDFDVPVNTVVLGA